MQELGNKQTKKMTGELVNGESYVGERSWVVFEN